MTTRLTAIPSSRPSRPRTTPLPRFVALLWPFEPSSHLSTVARPSRPTSWVTLRRMAQPTISRASGELETVTNEIGKWSGSSSQTHSDPHVGAPAPSGVFPITDIYSHEALGDGGSVCRIMEREIGRARARLDDVGADLLPASGGFGYYERHK